MHDFISLNISATPSCYIDLITLSPFGVMPVNPKLYQLDDLRLSIASPCQTDTIINLSLDPLLLCHFQLSNSSDPRVLLALARNINILDFSSRL